jgi:exonuclease I
VEEQLYEGGFWSDSDKFLMERFHHQSWEARIVTARQLSDKRLKQLSRRLIFIENRAAFSEAEQVRMEQMLRDRLLATDADLPRWTTIRAALREIDAELLNADFRVTDQLQEYKAFLHTL